MKTEKIKIRLAKLLAGDLEELGRLARDLGHELPRKRLEILKLFNADLPDEIPVDRYTMGYRPENEYIRGYLGALREVAAAYVAAVEPEVNEEWVSNFLRELEWVKPMMLFLLEGGCEAEVLLARFSDSFILTPDKKSIMVKRRSCSLEEIKHKLALLRQYEIVESIGEQPRYRLTLFGERVAQKILK